VEEEFRRIPTSAAPLDRVHGGRHRVIRVTEYGSAARCGAWNGDLEIGKIGTRTTAPASDEGTGVVFLAVSRWLGEQIKPLLK
jgi:hypothetical protein